MTLIGELNSGPMHFTSIGQDHNLDKRANFPAVDVVQSSQHGNGQIYSLKSLGTLEVVL